MTRKSTTGVTRFLPILLVLLLFGSTFTVKAADVTIGTPMTFAQALTVYDEIPATPLVLDISGNLTIATGGGILNNDPLDPPNADAFPVSLIVGGDMLIQTDGFINTENQRQAGYGGDITLIVGGSFQMDAGALITSSNLTATAGNMWAGTITLYAEGDITLAPGSVIKGNSFKGRGARIDIKGGKDKDITIGGQVLAQSTGTGAGCNPGLGGYITIVASDNLLVTDEGVVSSRGLDPGADLVHLSACYVTIYGLVESTGAGHALPTCPVSHLVPPFRPDKPANSTAGVEIWASKILIIDYLNHNGQINADLCCGGGSTGTSWIDLFSAGDLFIYGGAADLFAVHANSLSGNTDVTPGLVTVKSTGGNVNVSGSAIQVDGTDAGSNGGTIVIEADKDVNLNTASLFARGDFAPMGGWGKGGKINIRSFNNTITWTDGIGDVRPTGTLLGFLPANEGKIGFTKCTAGDVDVSGSLFPFSGTTASSPVTLPNNCGGIPFLPLEPGSLTYVVFEDCELPRPCYTCNGLEVVVDQNVTVNFNTNPPTYTGDPDLLPFFSFDNSGVTPDTWVAHFKLGQYRLLLTNNATITVTQIGAGNNRYAPGINIEGTCTMKIDNGSRIVVESLNRQAGGIIVTMEGNIEIDGEVRDEVKGTNGLPGPITIQSICGFIYVGPNGRILDLGVDPGGNLISLLTCGIDPPGDITVDNGLVKAYAHAHSDNLDATRPRIKVVSSGAVTINANTVEPIYDEFLNAGGRYDIWGGLLSWVRDNVKPGMVWVQAEDDIIVRGHGADPTGTVRTSFGAIAARATASSAPGGLIDVRSIGGDIYGYDRAFDVKGRNRLTFGNFANIKLFAAGDINLQKLGANATFNPVVDASGFGSGDKGGFNEFSAANINIDPGVIVTAAVPPSLSSVQGVNQFTYCVSYNNAGTVVPDPILIPGINCDVTPLFDCRGNLKIAEVIEPGTLEKEVPVNGMLIYPNPATESFTLQLNNATDQNATLILQDITGKVILRTDLQLNEGTFSYPVNVSTLSDGMYIVRLQTGTEIKQMKLLVRR